MTIFDIETGPLPFAELAWQMPEFEPRANLKDPEKIAADIAEKKAKWIENAALEATTGKVLAIGLIHDGETSILDGDEREMLTAFWKLYGAGSDFWHGFNIFFFDLPFLCRRSWIAGVKVPPGIRLGGRWNSRFIDLAESWKLGRRDEYPSLDSVSRALGLGMKTEDGACFAELWASDKPRAVEYLKNDLELTKKLAERIL